MRCVGSWSGNRQPVGRKRPGSPTSTVTPTAATNTDSDMISVKTRKVTGIDAIHIDASDSVMPSASVSQTLAEQTPAVSRRGPTPLQTSAPALHHHPPAPDDMLVDHETALPANSATTTKPQGRLRGHKKKKSTVQFNHRGDNAHFVKWDHRVGTKTLLPIQQNRTQT